MNSREVTTRADSVSVVIATYNRPDALVTAIRSVQSQSVSVHEIIVVGDKCDDETGRVLDALGEPRIRYVNLPERHGDQSLPNAAGVELASGEWVAFLNHDDVWFPKHVETLLSTIRETRRRWAFSSSIFSEGYLEVDGTLLPIINQVDLPNRTMWEAFGATLRYLEPVSNWVVSREGLLRAGNWRAAHESIRTPASRLGIRLWKELGDPAVCEEVTVLKIQGALQRLLGNDYASPSVLHRTIHGFIDNNPNDWFEGLPIELANRLSRRARLESNWPDCGVKPLPRFAVLLCAMLYRATGFDLLEWRLRRSGIRPGDLMDDMLRGRTGEVRVSGKSARVESPRDHTT